jgi:hypothetical protein
VENIQIFAFKDFILGIMNSIFTNFIDLDDKH